jgi:hypothetical protein
MKTMNLINYLCWKNATREACLMVWNNLAVATVLFLALLKKATKYSSFGLPL